MLVECLEYGLQVEDMTDPQKVHDDDKCDRDVTMYGWVRGTYLKPQAKVRQ